MARQNNIGPRGSPLLHIFGQADCEVVRRERCDVAPYVESKYPSRPGADLTTSLQTTSLRTALYAFANRVSRTHEWRTCCPSNARLHGRELLPLPSPPPPADVERRGWRTGPICCDRLPWQPVSWEWPLPLSVSPLRLSSWTHRGSPQRTQGVPRLARLRNNACENN